MNPILEEDESDSFISDNDISGQKLERVFESQSFGNNKLASHESTEEMESFESILQVTLSPTHDAWKNWQKLEQDFTPKQNFNSETFPTFHRIFEGDRQSRANTNPERRKSESFTSVVQVFSDGAIRKGDLRSKSFNLVDLLEEKVNIGELRIPSNNYLSENSIQTEALGEKVQEDVEVFKIAQGQSDLSIDQQLELILEKSVKPMNKSCWGLFNKGEKQRNFEILSHLFEKWDTVEQKNKLLLKDKFESNNKVQSLNKEINIQVKIKEQLVRETQQQSETNNDLKLQTVYEINYLNDQISSYNEAINKLQQQINIKREKFKNKNEQQMQKVERQRMLFEDLQVQYQLLFNHYNKAVNVRIHQSSLLEKLQQNNSLIQVKSKKIKNSIILMNQVNQYIQNFDGQQDIVGQIRVIIDKLRTETIESIEAEKQFKLDAITDPKEKMPYTKSNSNIIGLPKSPAFITSNY